MHGKTLHLHPDEYMKTLPLDSKSTITLTRSLRADHLSSLNFFSVNENNDAYLDALVNDLKISQNSQHNF